MMYKCDCGKEYDKVGSFNLHKYHCNLRKGIAPAVKNVPRHVPAGCVHEWILLSKDTTMERMALGEGYSKFCGKCEELE